MSEGNPLNQSVKALCIQSFPIKILHYTAFAGDNVMVKTILWLKYNGKMSNNKVVTTMLDSSTVNNSLRHQRDCKVLITSQAF